MRHQGFTYYLDLLTASLTEIFSISQTMCFYHHFCFRVDLLGDAKYMEVSQNVNALISAGCYNFIQKFNGHQSERNN